MSEIRKSIQLLAGVALVALSLPVVALAHGGGDMSEQPAQALAKQALSILTEKGDLNEAKERIDAAIDSKDQKGVNVAELRKADDALHEKDKSEALERIESALAGPKKETAEEHEEADREAGEEEGHDEGSEEASEDASGGQDEEQGEALGKDKPHRAGLENLSSGSGGVIAAILGVILMLLGIAGLLAGRRRSV